MAHWAVVIPAERWETERLFHHETVAVPGASSVVPGASSAAPGDDALLVAGDAVVALGRVVAAGPAGLEVAYERRAFDAPAPLGELDLDGPVTGLGADVFQRAAARLGQARDPKTWLVSVALPIEAPNQAEAVRQFWSHVLELGPGELPAYVWPTGDELAMQAYVLGVEANQDPEEDAD